jgi:hypothetical protein
MKLVKLTALVIGLALISSGCASLSPRPVAPPEWQVGNTQDTKDNDNGLLQFVGNLLACAGESLVK